MKVINIGTNDDGTPRLLYQGEPGEHILITPAYAAGEVTLPDGSSVDVTAHALAFSSEEQAQAVATAIETAFPIADPEEA